MNARRESLRAVGIFLILLLAGHGAIRPLYPQRVAASAPTVPANGAVKFARINATLLGDNTVVTGVSGKRIRVLGYMVTATLALSFSFKSGPNTTKVGPLDIAASQQLAYAGGLYSPAFETDVGEDLVLNNSILASTRGHLSYVEW